MNDLSSKKCEPCEAGTPPLKRKEARKYLSRVDSWELTENGKAKIRKEFRFPAYMDGAKFVNKVAELAEEEGHHPDIYLGWRRVRVELLTHAIGGLSENDFILAAKIDKLQAS